MSLYVKYPSNLSSAGGGAVTVYANFAAFPGSATDGTLAIAADTHILYEYNLGATAWQPIASNSLYANAATSIGTASGLTLASNVLSLALATGSTPGAVANIGAANGVATLDAGGLVPITQIPPSALERLVIVATQAARFALTTATVQNGDTVKQTDTNIMYFVSDQTNLGNAAGYTVYSAGTASAVAWSGITSVPAPVTALLGTNTGDVTLTAVGATPSANGASLSGQALTLQPASSTLPGVVTAAAQSFGGVKTFAGGISAPVGTGIQVEAFGVAALVANTTGQENTAFGYHALTGSTANSNTAFGSAALDSCTTGGNNTAMGRLACHNVMTGTDNTSVGQAALYNVVNTDASGMTGIGSNAGFAYGGHYGTMLGYGAGQQATGDYITALGTNALRLSTGAGTIGLGQNAGYSSTGANTLYIGDTTQHATNYAINSIYVNSSVAAGATVQSNLKFAGTLNLPGLTASSTLALDSSKNIITIPTTTGTVTSVTFTGDGTLLSTTPSTAVTTTGTLTAALKTQTKNTFLAGPTTGSAANPTFRTLNSADYTPPTIQKFIANNGATNYQFTVTAANATVGATYTNNGQTFTVLTTIAGATLLNVSGTGAPLASGTLTKSGGTGDATITFSAFSSIYVTPANVLYLKVIMVGGGGGGASTGTAGAAVGTAGTATTFGTSFLTANGGAGGNVNASLGGVGGTATSTASPGGFAFQGGNGGAGMGIAATASYIPGGTGGATPLGGAGAGGASGAAGYAAVANTGSGGGGASIANTNTSFGTGAGGGAGGYISVLVNTPSAIYTYGIGASGASGAAGTAGFAGGAGSLGIIIVEEHYQ